MRFQTLLQCAATFFLVHSSYAANTVSQAPSSLILKGNTSASSFQSLNADQPQSKVALKADVALPQFKAQVRGFFESGDRGSYSFDIDPIAGHWSRDFDPIGPATVDAWLGRDQPIPLHRREAVGANWAQNQSSPLHARTQGWIGGGVSYHHFETGLFARTAYSPVFLPNFGPGLGFSQHDPQKLSHFAQHPTTLIQQGEVLTPVHYELSQLNLPQTLIRPQAFFQVGSQSETLEASLLFWTAPRPTPSVDFSRDIQSNNSNGTPLASAVPLFERENFFATIWDFKTVIAQPRVQIVHETRSSEWTTSFEITPSSFLSAGFLHRFSQKTAPLVSRKEYADRLVWVDLHSRLGLNKWNFGLLVEGNLSPKKTGSFIEPRISYRANSSVSVFTTAQFLQGKTDSYFGNWDALDRVELGARIHW